MTYDNAAVVLIAIYDFLQNYGAFEFHIELSSVREGLIGSADLLYVESPPLLDGSNSTGNRPVAKIPTDDIPDPLSMHVTDSSVSITFHDIRRQLPAIDVASCIIQAQYDIIRALVDGGGDHYISRGKPTNFF